MAKGFISDIKGFQAAGLSLDKTDALFLTYFCLAGDKVTKSYLDEPWFGHGLSAYQMYAELRGSEVSLTYKNVRRRIVKLRDVGLIEQVREKKRIRRAIKYKATALGLFYRLLNQKENPVTLGVLDAHKDSVILQIILYPYFEHATIKQFAGHYHSLRYFTNYLMKCCEVIAEYIESRFIKNSGQAKSDLNDLSRLVAPEAMDLVFRIVRLSNIVMNDANEPNVTALFPVAALANDKKFMAVLKEMKTLFDEGYKKFGPLPEAIRGRSTMSVPAIVIGMIDRNGEVLDFKPKIS
jgi:hypothetical protein